MCDTPPGPTCPLCTIGPMLECNCAYERAYPGGPSIDPLTFAREFYTADA